MITEEEKYTVLAGIDVGSTTTKTVVLEEKSHTLLYSDYKRHHARQSHSVIAALQTLGEKFPGADILVAVTGSGSKPISEKLGVPYIQEVVANATALRSIYGEVGTAVELGGQDAKIIFFRKNQSTGALETADMRMNGSCAGGTGAFIDEIASVLNVPVEDFNALAA
ncbi:MAG: hypothetical protein LUD53_01890 [Clostridiales bacterium]|nr:hypothetical protein [Clostridiales bacterium]